MPAPAVNSSLEAANWFFRQAEKECLLLENEKLHHLLSLAQIHFALTHNFDYLMPSLFVCDENGFSDPTLSHALSFGRPLMPLPRLSPEADAFLSLIWKKYASLSIRDLGEFIKNSQSYADNYQPGRKNVVSLYEMASKFKNSLTPENFRQARKAMPKKIMISQNGPVVVSQWQPRKLNADKHKESKYV